MCVINNIRPNKILIIDNLKRRGWVIPNSEYVSPMQIRQWNSATHIYYLPIFGTGKPSSKPATANTTLSVFTQGNFELVILESQHKSVRQMQVTLCFVIWRERCRRRIFADEKKTPQLIATETVEEFSNWFQT